MLTLIPIGLSMAKGDLSGKLAVILHADVAGSTQLVQQNEQLAHERIQDSFRRFSNTISKYHGRVQELRGDALLAVFDRASDAVTAALAFQSDHRDHLENINDDIQPEIRVGIALGEVVIADSTVTGAGVVLAQRVEQLAEPGGLCITSAIHEALPNRMPFSIESLGEQALKGFEEHVRVYRVQLVSGKSVPPPQQISRRQVIPKNWWQRVAIAAVVVLIAVGIGYWLKHSLPQEEPALMENMAFPLPDKPSIAVLPFTNMSDDPKQEYFAQGMTDDLITDLSKVSGLFVISRHSTLAYKDKAVKIRQVAEELGVRYILEGSVRRVGDEVRINAQLIDALTGGHVWAERYDRKIRDIFALQVDIVDQVASVLSVKMQAGEQGRLHRTYALSVDSYELYLRARTILPTYMTDNGRLQRARQLFERLIEQADNFPGGYAGLSQTYALAVMRGYSPMPVEEAKQALALARTAWDIDAEFELSEIAMANAQQITGQSEDAIATLEKMLISVPSNADAHAQRGRFLVWAGRAKEAIEPIKKAIRLNPNAGSTYLIDLGLANFTSGNYEAAITAFEKNHARGGPIDDAGLAVWTASNSELGRSNEAATVLNRLFYSHPDFHLRSFWLLRMYVRPEDRIRLNDIFQRADIPIDRPYTR